MKRGLEAKNARSNAGSDEKSGGFGKTPWLNAYAEHRHRDREVEDELDANAAAIAG